MAQARSMGMQRVGAIGLLLVVGVMSLPVTAYFLDGEGAENWILPVALVVAAVGGAVIGAVLPDVAGAGATVARGAVRGALIGVLMCLVGLVIFFILLSGFDGA